MGEQTISLGESQYNLIDTGFTAEQIPLNLNEQDNGGAKGDDLVFDLTALCDFALQKLSQAGHDFSPKEVDNPVENPGGEMSARVQVRRIEGANRGGVTTTNFLVVVGDHLAVLHICDSSIITDVSDH